MSLYSDGWMRTYLGYPEMNDEIKGMLYDYINNGKLGSVALFFSEKCGFDADYSDFLLRELLEGKL